ncbi:MAG: hypothetical protein GF419_13700 [Ignavibacteriales bacterium]|nr:hypothetical protein [Ignavibacteriales bacterium]
MAKITKEEFKELFENYKKHKAAGTLKNIALTESFDIEEVKQLVDQPGVKYVSVTQGAKEDGTNTNMLSAFNEEWEQQAVILEFALYCPPPTWC